MAKDTTGRLHVTVKSGGKRKLSSKLWLERQLNDPYVAQAKRDGYRSRAAYKLIEIDDKHRFLKHGIAVVDLGAAPGGWSQIAAKRVGAVSGKGKVVAIDLLEMPEVPGVNFAQLDFLGRGRAGKTDRHDGRPRRRRDVRHGAPTPPATARPISCASSAWSKPRRRLPPTCSIPAARFWPRSFRAAPTPNWSRN